MGARQELSEDREHLVRRGSTSEADLSRPDSIDSGRADDRGRPGKMQSMEIGEEEDFAMDVERGASSAGTGFVGHRRKRPRREPALLKFIALLAVPVLVLCGLFFVIARNSPNGSKNANPESAPTGSVYPSGFNMKNNWGAYSPYFDGGIGYDGIDQEANHGEYTLPQGCAYKQVHVLHRHGERYPSGGVDKMINKVVEKLEAMTRPPAKQLQWLEHWNYTLGTDLLVAQGTATEFTSGSAFWASHGRLLYGKPDALFYSKDLNVFDNGTERPVPVLRTTSQSRIHASARAWAAGFFGVYGDMDYSPEDNEDLYHLVVMREGEPGSNNSLASYYGCPNADEAENGGDRRAEWIDHYLKHAAKRLTKLLPGIEELTPENAFAIQNLCAFETAAYGSSAFCELFTETEWRGFEYASDLHFYGDSSYGSKVATAIGVPWLTELAARLENKYVDDWHRGVNTTLDTDPLTFPLEQPFYLDMTHDGIIISVLTTLGLDFMKKELPSNKIPVPRAFIASRLVPFGARMYVEVLGCDEDERYIRIKLNNRILPLGSLKHCPHSSDGLCPYDKFVKSVHHAIDQVDYIHLCYDDIL